MDILAFLQPTGCSIIDYLLVLFGRIANGDTWIAPFAFYLLFH